MRRHPGQPLRGWVEAPRRERTAPCRRGLVLGREADLAGLHRTTGRRSLLRRGLVKRDHAHALRPLPRLGLVSNLPAVLAPPARVARASTPAPGAAARAAAPTRPGLAPTLPLPSCSAPPAEPNARTAAVLASGGFTELTLDPAEGRGKTRVGGDRDGASGCLPGLRRGGADQVGPRLRPAALAVQGLRP